MKQENKEDVTVKTLGGNALIIEARFYTDIADNMVDGATRVLETAGMNVDRISVPGALEIPSALLYAANTGEYDVFVVLGCVIRGETYHFEIVCNESNRGIYDVVLSQGLALGNGVLTVDTKDQADERADPARGDKGGDAARAAVRMLELKKHWAFS